MRIPITLLCVVTFIVFEVCAVLPCPSGAFGWTAINAIGCIGLWLIAGAHIEIGELGDFTEGETWLK